MNVIVEITKIKYQLNSPFRTPDFLDKAYYPSLNGWRAIAITLVVLGHAKATTTNNSAYHNFAQTFIYENLGVRIFFVLSGFLITSLLIKEYIKTNSINVRKFFLKRILRIFPVLYIYLLCILIVNTVLKIDLNLDNFLGPVLYINNFNFFQGTWLTGHTWSLAVEEQYYFIWPLLFSKFLKNTWSFCIIMLLFLPILKIFWYYNPELKNLTLEPFLANADAIFMGSFFSILSFKGFFTRKQRLWNNSVLFIISIIIIEIIYFFSSLGLYGPILLPFGNFINNILIIYMIMNTLINTTSFIYKFLNLKYIVHIGVISYSLYMWQQLFIVPTDLYNGKLSSFLIFPFNIVLALCAGQISYQVIEKFFQKIKEKFVPVN